MTEKKYGGRLENWSHYGLGLSAFGNLFDDPNKRFPDGAEVNTSRVVKIEGNGLETLNSYYDLGKEYVVGDN